APPDPPDEGAPPASEVLAARAEVLGLLGAAPVAVDDLMRRCQLSAAAVQGALLELELGGQIETLPGNRVARLAE
ncbi:DprA-like winged helix domain-containing protein, partial [Acidisphaera rubrifaciens]